MKRIENKLSKIEKVVKDQSGSGHFIKFLNGLSMPESDDLLMLDIERIIKEALIGVGKLPAERMSEFLDKLRDYCNGKTVKIWSIELVEYLTEKKSENGAKLLYESKPSRPLNYELMLRMLDREEGGE